MPGVVEANTTGSPEAPPVADTAKVPPTENTGFVGVAMKAVITCVADPIVTLKVSCGAAL